MLKAMTIDPKEAEKIVHRVVLGLGINMAVNEIRKLSGGNFTPQEEKALLQWFHGMVTNWRKRGRPRGASAKALTANPLLLPYTQLWRNGVRSVRAYRDYIAGYDCMTALERNEHFRNRLRRQFQRWDKQAARKMPTARKPPAPVTRQVNSSPSSPRPLLN
jgi:hypothetical protein